MKRIFAIEGHDRVGKDTILKALPKYIKDGKLPGLSPLNATVFDQDPIREKYKDIIEDYKDPKNWKTFMTAFIRDVSEKLVELFKVYDYVFVTRWTLSEHVFNDMFERTDMDIIQDTMNELMPEVDVVSFIMCWSSYDEYLKRLAQIKDDYVQYSFEENSAIKLLFNKHKSYTDMMFNVLASATVDDILTDPRVTDFIRNNTRPDFVFNVSPKWQNIEKKIIISDMDGVLTNGTSLYSGFGKQMKEYGSYDKEAMHIAQRAGWEILFVSADTKGFEISRARANDLNIEIREVAPKDRLKLILEYKRAGYFVAYIGDSISDIYALDASGFAGVPNNACQLVKNFVGTKRTTYISKLDGGRGAFGDIVTTMLLTDTKFFIQ